MKLARYMLAGMLLTFPISAACSASPQTSFDSPQTAANNFVLAVARGDKASLGEILGSDYREVLPIEQINAAVINRFLDAWADYHALVPESENVRVLTAGLSGWTLPIPIIRDKQGWRFDTRAGRERMLVRRIGRNELSAIQAVLAYHDAQMEYAQKDRDNDGVLEYAQRFISHDKSHDGLYWKPADGQPESPLGPLFGDNIPDGAYHGYKYRILTAQGAHARGGASNYLRNGNMVDGFALVAWPAAYGESGINTFMIDRTGIVVQADLGPNTADAAQKIQAYDPAWPWTPVASIFTGLAE